MPDREKVTQWLETCISGCEDGCPYEYKNLVYRVECKTDLMADALNLLRKQEPVKPDYDPVYQIWTCGNCGKTIYRAFRYCPYCRREVKWDGDR